MLNNQTEEILINVTPQETRVAFVANGMLQELHIERSDKRGIVGNIYNGKVVRVLPGMQAAFVDIGLERTAFLHVRDAGPLLIEGNPEDLDDEEKQKLRAGRCIEDIVRPGQDILVQAVKDPLGSKGARLTTEISIPSRYLVFLPGVDTTGISQRISDLETREKLRQYINQLRADSACKGGLIARTCAEPASEDELRQDMEVLSRIWQKINTASKSKAPALVYQDLPLSHRIVRDFIRDGIHQVQIDSHESFDKLRQFAQEVMPEAESCIQHYQGQRPLFDLYSIEDDIQRALDRSVPLKSGGSLVIDQTEAMTTIDVNTGGFVGKKNLEDTVFKTNLEAAQAVARQLRLRNIGGIIIVDFIDMMDSGHQAQVLGALERGLEQDSTKNSMSDMSPLGLVEITRKRTRESLERVLTEDCPACQGIGRIKTAQTICNELFREVIREARLFDAKQYMIVASQTVIDRLIDEDSSYLADLQEFIGSSIHLQVEPSYSQDLYDVILT